MGRSTPRLLRFASGVALLFAAYSAFLVGERVFAAAWSAYKFSGEGPITLSTNTAILFAACVLGIAGAAYGIQRAADARGDRWSSRIARAALVLVVGAGVVYLVLGISLWNQWRA